MGENWCGGRGGSVWLDTTGLCGGKGGGPAAGAANVELGCGDQAAGEGAGAGAVSWLLFQPDGRILVTFHGVFWRISGIGSEVMGLGSGNLATSSS